MRRGSSAGTEKPGEAALAGTGPSRLARAAPRRAAVTGDGVSRAGGGSSCSPPAPSRPLLCCAPGALGSGESAVPAPSGRGELRGGDVSRWVPLPNGCGRGQQSPAAADAQPSRAAGASSAAWPRPGSVSPPAAPRRSAAPAAAQREGKCVRSNERGDACGESGGGVCGKWEIGWCVPGEGGACVCRERARM